MTVKPFSKQNFATRNYNVINAVPVATYSLSSLAASYNEGDTITITITTGFIADGTVLYWTTTGTTTGADFSDGVTSGSVTITNNSGTVTRTLLSDLSTEGTETFVFNLLTGSTSGTIVASTSSANILDTSISPLNYSVNFNGSSQYLVLPLNSGFAIGTGDFTVEAWVYPRTLQYWGTIIAGANFGSGSDWGFYTGDGTSRYPFFQMTNSGYDTILATSFIPLNTWSHLAVTRSSGTVRIFINGILSNSGTFATQSLDNSYQKGIGGCYNGNGNTLLNGYISNVRVVKGTAVYTAAFTPPTTALTAITNTSLLTCKSGTIADASTNALTITNTGTALVSGENPFGNYSMSFNSTSQYLSVAANTALDFGTGNFTIEFWLYGVTDPGGSSGYNLIFCSPETNTYTVGTYNGAIFFHFNGGAFLDTAAGLITPNVWYHIAVAKQSSVTTIYLNGVSKASIADTNNYSGSPSRTIGPSAGGTAGFYMTNVRIVKGTAVYTANFSPPTAPLSAISGTSLLTAQYPELFDASTNHFVITNTGSTKASTANPFDNYAYSFKGDNTQYITASNVSALGTSDFTFECWINITGIPSSVYGGEIVSNWGGSGGWQITVTQDLKINWQLYSTNNASFTGNLSLNTWYHIAVCRSGGSIRTFVNGVLNETVTNSYNATNTGLTINGQPGGAYSVPCYISNLRLVIGTGLYTATFTPPTSPLTAISGTALLTCQYAELFDASSNNRLLTPTGSPPAVATNLFVAPNNLKNYSAKFGGTSSQYLTLPASDANLTVGTSNFTFECWTYLTVSQVSCMICLNQLRIEFGSSTNISVIQNGIVVLTTNTIASVLNTWTHVAISRTGGTLYVFINGALVTSLANSTNFTGGTNRIGIEAGSLINPFAGYISNLRFIKGTGLYTSAFTPSATPLLPVANTVLLTLQSNRIYDAGPNQLAITNTGSVTMSYLSPFST